MRPSTILTSALIGCAALIAGCGSTSPPPSAPSAALNPDQAAFAYARCMRAHGVSDFPDPQVTTTPGSTAIRQALPASAAASPAFKTAQAACARLQPGRGSGGPGGSGPGKQMLLAFARCLRAHGLVDFPDPNAQGRLTLEMISAAGVDVRASSFLTAGRACIGVTHGAITPAQLAAAASGQH
jgi:hypothetical protein